MFFQAVRQEVISLRNITSAWRAAGLKLYNPSLILLKYRPKTPLFTSFTNKDGTGNSLRIPSLVTSTHMENALEAGYPQAIRRAFKGRGYGPFPNADGSDRPKC